MKHILSSLIYIGVGCAYQSSYDDVTIRQIVTLDAPVSVFGHIFAWPFVMFYHGLSWIGWGFAALAAIVVVGLCIVLAGSLLDSWRRRKRLAERLASLRPAPQSPRN